MASTEQRKLKKFIMTRYALQEMPEVSDMSETWIYIIKSIGEWINEDKIIFFLTELKENWGSNSNNVLGDY